MFDVLIVGGRYAGLSAAMQLARARCRICVVDSGTPRNRFATASHGFFGQDGASPRQMIEDARKKLLAYPSVTFLRDSVNTAERDKDIFKVVLASGAHVQARKLVLAFGLKDEMLPIPGLSERWGHSVLHCPYCHGYEFADQRLGVLAMSSISIHQGCLSRSGERPRSFSTANLNRMKAPWLSCYCGASPWNRRPLPRWRVRDKAFQKFVSQMEEQFL